MIREFTIRIIDAQCKEHEFGPIALDVPENNLIGWDAVAADEAEAVKAAKADLTAAIYVPTL